MYTYGLKHEQPRSNDRRRIAARRMEMERLRPDGRAMPLHAPSPSLTSIPTDFCSGYVNAITPDVRINFNGHTTPSDTPSWLDDRPIHTPEWRTQLHLTDEIRTGGISPGFNNFTPQRVSCSMPGPNHSTRRHFQASSLGCSNSLYSHNDNEGFERSPPPPYTPDPSALTNQSCHSSRHTHTSRSRQHSHSSPSQMQMVRYDPNAADHSDRGMVRSSSYTESEARPSQALDMRRSSNWSNTANYGSVGYPSPQPYRSEYTHFLDPSATYPQRYNLNANQTYRDIHDDIYEAIDDDGDFMSDGVASDEGEYYSSDGGHLDQFEDDEYEDFSDNDCASPMDGFYGAE